MRILAALLLLGGFIQPPTLPGAVSPFPTGLSGGIVFMSDRPGADNPQGRNHIFALDLASGRVSQLPPGRDHHEHQPKWSPDGRRISFVSSRGGNFDLYVMNADGTNVTRVTDHP